MTWLLSFSRVFAACTSSFMLLSPAPMVYKIHKDQHSGVMSIVPLAAVLVNSHMWMMYGYLDENYFPVFATFLAGDAFLGFFIAVFYRWTHERRKAHYVFAVAGLAMAAMTSYSLLAGYGYTGQSRQGVVNTAGALSAMTGTVMYASPLEKIFHVFKYKSAAFVPIYLVCAGALNNTAWILFAMLTGKYIILVPSFFALAGNLFQVVLYFFVYNPKTHPLVLDDETGGSITTTTPASTGEIQVVVAPESSFHSLGSPSRPLPKSI